MRFSLSIVTVMSIILACLNFTGCSPRAGGSSTGGSFPGHPRLILSGKFLDQVKQDIQGRSAQSYLALKASVDSVITSTSSDSIPVRVQARLAEKCGFLYLVTGGLFGFGVLYDFWTLNEQITLLNAGS